MQLLSSELIECDNVTSKRVQLEAHARWCLERDDTLQAYHQSKMSSQTSSYIASSDDLSALHLLYMQES